MTSLGKYQLKQELGRGGFGIVYLALDTTRNIACAVKVLHPNLSNDPHVVARFRQEAQIAANLSHPNIVPVIDLDQIASHTFLVMPYLPGGSIRELLAHHGKLTVDQSLSIVDQVAAALNYAHSKNLIHRDVKPANILFDENGLACLTDFGIARVLSGSSSSSSLFSHGFLGTAPYIAPEVWKGKPIGSASDEYSLACVFYEMIAGKVLFNGETPPVIMTRHVLESPFISAEWPEGTPKEFKNVLIKALAKEPEVRFSNSLEFVRALHAARLGRYHSKERNKHNKTIVGTGFERINSPWILTLPALLLLGILGLVVFFLITGLSHGFRLPGSRVGDLLPTISPAGVFDEPPTELPQMGVMVETVIPSVPPNPTDNPTQTPEAGSIQVSVRDGMKQIYIPAGEFLYGAPDAVNGFPDERPQNKVYLEDYWIDQTEVTNKMYSLCVDAGVCRPPMSEGSLTRKSYFSDKNYEDYPVVYLRWDDARTYCEWAGRRLPTEAEWEKAARGLDGRKYPWGGYQITCDHANYWEYEQVGKSGSLTKRVVGCEKDTLAVGIHPEGASPYGVFDMLGNVREWVADWYDEDYYNWLDTSDPTGPEHGEYRVIRGALGFIEPVLVSGAKRERSVVTGGGGSMEGVVYFQSYGIRPPTSSSGTGYQSDYTVRNSDIGAYEFVFVLRTTLRHLAPPNMADYNLGFRCVASP